MQTKRDQSTCDVSLVYRTLSGDLMAYGTLVDRYRGAVLLIAREALGSHTEAEDVAQEVFLIVYQSLTRLREPERFSSWLYAITRFRARKLQKQVKRQIVLAPTQVALLQEYIHPNAVQQPQQILLNAEQEQELWAGIEALKPDWRIALLLYAQEEWSVPQIAQFLALPTTTVNWRLHQARTHLKQYLNLAERKNNNE